MESNQTQRVLITGASSGIGRATALRFASAGANLAITGRNRARLIDVAAMAEESGANVRWWRYDLADLDAPNQIVEETARWAGGLDVVVNCAGTFPSQRFAEIEDPDWSATIALNLTAPMRLFRAAVPHLRASDRAVLLSVSSINAHFGDALSACSAYATAKAGQEALIRQAATELADFGIRVVAVAPGAVETPMLDGWTSDPGELQEWLSRYVPLRRLADPDEIAAVIEFLCSADASYITGTTVMVDGGMSIV